MCTRCPSLPDCPPHNILLIVARAPVLPGLTGVCPKAHRPVADVPSMKRPTQEGTSRVETRVETRVREEREAQFARNMDAFIRRDYSVIDATMRADVVLEMPGSSWLAGTYRGLAEVSRSVVALRQVFNSDKKLVTFLHGGDHMVVRHAIAVSGPHHDVEMNLSVRIGYDEEGKFATINVEPSDLGLFDYVVNSRLDEPDQSQEASSGR